MRARARAFRGVSLLLVGILTLLTLFLSLSAPLQAESWPADVHVVYDVNFNGLNIGTFEFRSQAEEESYTLTGNAYLSVLLGAFKWRSETRSFGLIVNEAPKPAGFMLDYKSSLTAGSTKLGFSDGSVTEVKQLPTPVTRPDTVPVRAQHLKGVLDPLSAVMAISRGASAQPCERRVPIFDGKERFDLQFSYKGQKPLTDQQSTGAVAIVCRVKYLPIAGHKVDSATTFMAANDDIEVTLLPIPSVNLSVLYAITIPMPAGFATLLSKRVDIASPGKPQIALTP